MEHHNSECHAQTHIIFNTIDKVFIKKKKKNPNNSCLPNTDKQFFNKFKEQLLTIATVLVLFNTSNKTSATTQSCHVYGL